MKKLLFLLPVLALVFAGCNKTQPIIEEPISILETTGSTVVVEPEVIVPQPQIITVYLAEQPTQLPGNYQDNSTFLRARAEKNNKVNMDIPAGATDIRIGFEFNKNPHWDNIPGNLQLSLDGKNFCNGRLSKSAATVELDTNTYRYDFDNISTQEQPKGIDLTPTIGKTLGIKVWIGEHATYIKSIILSYKL